VVWHVVELVVCCSDVGVSSPPALRAGDAVNTTTIETRAAERTAAISLNFMISPFRWREATPAAKSPSTAIPVAGTRQTPIEA
jgi:hypothetical protein